MSAKLLHRFILKKFYKLLYKVYVVTIYYFTFNFLYYIS